VTSVTSKNDTAKSLWLSLPGWRAGIETFLICAAAAALAYVAGVVLKNLRDVRHLAV